MITAGVEMNNKFVDGMFIGLIAAMAISVTAMLITIALVLSELFL